MNLDELNTAPTNELVTDLLRCADVPWWAEAIAEARPFKDIETLREFASQKAADFTARDIERALVAHARIGAPPTGEGAEASWSRQEQAAASTHSDVVADELAQVNREYEQRFGRVFLICATGLTAQEILDSARKRLTNTDDDELVVVGEELRKIALLRLGKLLS